MMHRFGLSVDSAMDGNEAVNLVRKRVESDNSTYKLILMDYSMPNCNGSDATKQIRMFLFSQAPHLQQPFICCVMSYVERSYQQEVLEAGMNGFLTRPVFQAGIKRLLAKANINSESE